MYITYLLNFFKSKLAKAIYVVICTVIIISLSTSLISLSGKLKIVHEREAVNLQKKKENMELKRKLEESTSNYFVEKEARNKLGFVKEGEYIVEMPNIPIFPTNNMSDINKTLVKESNLSKWWKLFL